MNKKAKTNLKYQYVNGLCGSGKTHALIQHLKINTYSKSIIAVPSCNLANEIYKKAMQLDMKNVHLIHSETCEGNVLQAIQDTIASIDSKHNGTGLIICTQQAVVCLPYWSEQRNWNLFVDEIPQVDSYHEIAIPYNHPLLRNYIRISGDFNSKLYSVGLYSKKSTDELLERNHDDIDAIFKPLVEEISSGNYDVVTCRKYWDKVVTNNDITPDSEVDLTYGNTKNKLYFVSMLRPSIFHGYKQVTFMGANFEESLLYRWWSDYHEVDFVPAANIQKKLRYAAYQNGHRLTIKYLQEDKWSKYQRDIKLPEPVMIHGTSCRYQYEMFDAMVNKEFANTDFLYAANNDIKEEDTKLKGIRIPVISHGMNTWDHYNAIYFSPALNRRPKHMKMLDALGLDEIYINRASMHEVAHQNIMRTSLRRPEANDNVTVIVVDKWTADALARLFINCKVGPIDGALKKVVALTQKQKDKRSKAKKLKERLFNQGEFDELRLVDGEALVLSGFGNKFSKEPDSITMREMEFVSEFQQLFNNNHVHNKNDEFLFNLTKFVDPVNRTLANVEYVTGVILDIDDGDMSVEEFERIFAKHKYSHITMNSFSRSEENPNNFRAVFFLKESVDVDVYTDVWDHLANIIADEGFATAKSKAAKALFPEGTKFSGLDWSKRHAASIFYIPCQVIGREEWAFFNKVRCKQAQELKRYAIDPKKVIKFTKEETELGKLVFEVEKKTIESNDDSNEPMSRDEIIEFCEEHQPYFGDHSEYVKFVSGARNAGLDLSDVIHVSGYISNSKKARDAERMWRAVQNYDRITPEIFTAILRSKVAPMKAAA